MQVFVWDRSHARSEGWAERSETQKSMAQVPANDGFRRTLPILREYLPSLGCGIASRPVASSGYQHLTHAVPLAKLLLLVRAHSSAGEHCIQTTVYMTSALSSVVEHRLHTAGVAGSKPAVRTKKHRSHVQTAGTDLGGLGPVPPPHPLDRRRHQDRQGSSPVPLRGHRRPAPQGLP